jgi:hypothetical protein
MFGWFQNVRRLWGTILLRVSVPAGLDGTPQASPSATLRERRLPRASAFQHTALRRQPVDRWPPDLSIPQATELWAQIVNRDKQNVPARLRGGPTAVGQEEGHRPVRRNWRRLTAAPA